MSVTASTNGIDLDPRTYKRGLGCVHCGLCLPACPTYTQTFNEADSPRGRIQLMLALADKEIEPTESVRHHLDLCLDCRACETACPSGVVYHELIEETRSKMQPSKQSWLQEMIMRRVFFHVLVHPARLKLSMMPGRIFKKLGLFNILPQRLSKMGQMMPTGIPLWPKRLPEKSVGGGKMRLAFFPGCVGSVIYDRVNRKAIELLNACGADVFVQRGQVCCGAIHHHNGAHEHSMKLARQNIDAMLPTPDAMDYIVTDVAGCGAMLREYDTLLRDDPKYAERARQFVAKVRDISEVLMQLKLPVMKHRVDKTITYHDACHLIHAQRVSAEPRALLNQIPGLQIRTLTESDMCCGAAGTYNLTQPAMAMDLADRKLKNIAETGAEMCATGNVGCSMHIQSQADSHGQTLRVVHPVELLHAAIFGSQI